MNEKREMLIRALQHRGEYEAASEIQNLQARVADLKAELKRHIGLHIDTINNRAALEKGDD